MVSGVEKEYATRKATKMDFGGNGEGQVVATTGEGQQVEGKLLLNEGEMIQSPNKSSKTKKVVDHELFIEWDFQELIGGSITSMLDVPNNLGNNIGDLSHDVQVVSEKILVGVGFHVAIDSPISGVNNLEGFIMGNIEL